ncbi:MAG: hypothetical protein QNK37_00065 [Acidobacteriota bacterium]|nr:hypothetical protein [Acidobacteriota bacterium]
MKKKILTALFLAVTVAPVMASELCAQIYIQVWTATVNGNVDDAVAWSTVYNNMGCDPLGR